MSFCFFTNYFSKCINCIRYFFQLDNDIILLIAFEEEKLLPAKSKVEQFIKQTKASKIIECKNLETKFIIKHLLPSSLLANETSVGLEVAGLPANVQNCNVLIIILVIDID